MEGERFGDAKDRSGDASRSLDGAASVGPSIRRFGGMWDARQIRPKGVCYERRTRGDRQKTVLLESPSYVVFLPPRGSSVLHVASEYPRVCGPSRWHQRSRFRRGRSDFGRRTRSFKFPGKRVRNSAASRDGPFNRLPNPRFRRESRDRTHPRPLPERIRLRDEFRQLQLPGELALHHVLQHDRRIADGDLERLLGWSVNAGLGHPDGPAKRDRYRRIQLLARIDVQSDLSGSLPRYGDYVGWFLRTQSAQVLREFHPSAFVEHGVQHPLVHVVCVPVFE